MRFLVDECTGPAVAEWLKNQGHEVFSVYDECGGIDDGQVIKIAFEGNWILITNDKDFGERVYREKYPHHGVILLRLDNERNMSKISAIRRLLDSYATQIANNFVVVTEKAIRFAIGKK